MPDPAQQLARLYAAGFSIEQLERFPRAVAVVRGECIALFEPNPEGLKAVGKPGWRIGEAIGVLVEQRGKPVFQAKQEILEATPERFAQIRGFEQDLNRLLLSAA